MAEKGVEEQVLAMERLRYKELAAQENFDQFKNKN